MQHIYLASVQEVPDDFETKLNELNEQRRAKVLRCKNIMDKKRSYLAGKLLSRAAEEEGIKEVSVCMAPYDWETIRRQENHTCYANVSHSGEYVAVAISDGPVGVDIEQYGTRYGKTKAKNSINPLAKKVLNEAEYAKFQSLLTGENQPENKEPFENEKDFFLKIWTRKEAYAKWDGKGIAMNFSEIDALGGNDFYSKKIFLEDQDFLWLSVYPFSDNQQNVPNISFSTYFRLYF